MTYIILFEDNPDADPAIRRTHMPSHLAFLKANEDAISVAGPLFAPSGEGRGGLWVVNADSAGEAERLVREDPFWPTGLRQNFTVLKWNRVFAKGVALI